MIIVLAPILKFFFTIYLHIGVQKRGQGVTPTPFVKKIWSRIWPLKLLTGVFPSDKSVHALVYIHLYNKYTIYFSDC